MINTLFVVYAFCDSYIVCRPVSDKLLIQWDWMLAVLYVNKARMGGREAENPID